MRYRNIPTHLVVILAAGIGAAGAWLASHHKRKRKPELSRSEYWRVYADVLEDLSGCSDKISDTDVRLNSSEWQ
ncbi:MAG TPA: hypothetical protein VFX60_15980 [Micromonospora sp.]|nr:hypothetical protein [Micromonospora sp.]